ncbi:alpha-L-fucosidase [Flavivirga amylovorans]|uniref:alpha-L-fucosidase n=1 Tax=Flavivirga amylovorans TaxID=870486 RepID=A0ABT8X6Y2_9FLAO|nr:alpha-L-fucosidase [Flavivirga amylovorans]MDO5989746.1 alpha-L-fucosidase [Flavivirga amylovorans]
MKKLTLIMLIVFAMQQITAQKIYEATWESLDSRKDPEWFSDAKFGIFIHWGLYSVPGYTAKGNYAEWYGNHLKKVLNEKSSKHDSIRHLAAKSYQDKVYGADFKYSDFRDLFTTHEFDAKQWAGVFKKSGAKYVVLTSKHHDGYCLWPSKEASKSFGLPWNSVESGPKRDLVGELTNAVRAEGIKMGLYYSIWDWYNPYWSAEQQEALKSGTLAVDLNNIEAHSKSSNKEVKESMDGLSKYIHEVMYPQFKEIVNNYQPSLIFSDGDWWMNDDLWETRPLLAWLFNNAPNKDEVVINDRWGQVRGEHGGYYTTEYGSGFDNIDKPWEENRGIGHSFGYNRIENLEDYKTSQELVYVLIDIVSRGGNLLLNIGPRADGLIPVIMQQRLIDIGDWLDVNGEAIYGTKTFGRTCQWSAGKKPSEVRGGFKAEYDVMALTVEPKEGMASKEVFFTQKENDLYCICPVYPKGKLIIKDLDTEIVEGVEMLGYDKPLEWKKQGGNIVINVPPLTISEVPCNFAWTFKIKNISQ